MLILLTKTYDSGYNKNIKKNNEPVEKKMPSGSETPTTAMIMHAGKKFDISYRKSKQEIHIWFSKI